MKKILILLAMWVAVVSTTFAQATYSTTVYTLNSSAVAATGSNYEPLSASDIAYCNDYVAQNYPNATQLSPASGRYNCHSYAWHNTSTSNTTWISDPTAYRTDGSYYNDCAWKNGTRVFYSSANITDWHSAVDYNGTTFKSKWGPYPLMQHAYNYSPYSGTLYFYTRNNFCPASCGTVTGLTTANLTASKVTLLWTALCGVTSYRVELRTSTSSVWTTFTVTNTPTALYRGINLQGLTAGRCYYFRVTANCNGTLGSVSSSAYFCAPASMAAPNTGSSTTPMALAERSSNGDEDGQILDLTLPAEMDMLTDLQISPNPSQGALLLHLTTSKAQSTTIEVADATGKTVYSKPTDLTEGSNSMDLQLSLPAGIYLVRAQIDGKMMVQKLVIEH